MKALTALKKGKARVIVGDPDSSEVIKRLITTDSNELMPPPDHGKPPKADEIKIPVSPHSPSSPTSSSTSIHSLPSSPCLKNSSFHYSC
jgi:hypothetical protein